ncbi:hypothetical protein GCM10009837_35740 [Streptomyces durmitorensis]|uniref:Tyr recombinase domain-containing protein n=1 Tax=Streptomyces durmitorensis TaxID=319947 RepID=A0ABY4PWM4_9ACTN|nr:tyrosine-type recombinase/integrase [Streptomyces durmitorensis]UQT57589.1 hypothetical protein M4V62_22170 [Streptomyces durmitorensis]
MRGDYRLHGEGRVRAAASRDRLSAAYELAVRLGLRRGEILGLSWKDVDLADGVIDIRQSLQRVGGELSLTADEDPPLHASARAARGVPDGITGSPRSAEARPAGGR